MEYDDEKRLIKAWENGALKLENLYDVKGNRVRKVENGRETVSLYIGNNLVYEWTADVNTRANATETWYIFVGNRRVAKVTDGTVQYFVTDHLGSTRVISDLSGAVVQQFHYKPFGEDSVTPSPSGPKFTGKPQDGIGLYYYGARFYDPELGRFITMDPARDGLNWYVYAENNPLKYVDPDGQVPWLVVFRVGNIAANIVLSSGLEAYRSFKTEGQVNWSRVRRGAVQGAVIGLGFGAAPRGVVGYLANSTGRNAAQASLGIFTTGTCFVDRVLTFVNLPTISDMLPSGARAAAALIGGTSSGLSLVEKSDKFTKLEELLSLIFSVKDLGELFLDYIQDWLEQQNHESSSYENDYQREVETKSADDKKAIGVSFRI